MAQYVGRRIVPVHGGVWDKNKAYEELTIVLHAGSGDSYISRRPVPAGTAVTDEHYWMLHSLYSQQIAEAAAQMEATEKRIEKRSADAESQMQSRVEHAENLTNSNKEELNERMDGLDARLDANVSASTDENADYAAEVVDARVGADEKTYASMGAHLRALDTGSAVQKLDGYKVKLPQVSLKQFYEYALTRKTESFQFSYDAQTDTMRLACIKDYDGDFILFVPVLSPVDFAYLRRQGVKLLVKYRTEKVVNDSSAFKMGLWMGKTEELEKAGSGQIFGGAYTHRFKTGSEDNEDVASLTAYTLDYDGERGCYLREDRPVNLQFLIYANSPKAGEEVTITGSGSLIYALGKNLAEVAFLQNALWQEMKGVQKRVAALQEGETVHETALAKLEEKTEELALSDVLGCRELTFAPFGVFGQANSIAEEVEDEYGDMSYRITYVDNNPMYQMELTNLMPEYSREVIVELTARMLSEVGTLRVQMYDHTCGMNHVSGSMYHTITKQYRRYQFRVSRVNAGITSLGIGPSCTAGVSVQFKNVKVILPDENTKQVKRPLQYFCGYPDDIDFAKLTEVKLDKPLLAGTDQVADRDGLYLEAVEVYSTRQRNLTVCIGCIDQYGLFQEERSFSFAIRKGRNFVKLDQLGYPVPAGYGVFAKWNADMAVYEDAPDWGIQNLISTENVYFENAEGYSGYPLKESSYLVPMRFVLTEKGLPIQLEKMQASITEVKTENKSISKRVTALEGGTASGGQASTLISPEGEKFYLTAGVDGTLTTIRAVPKRVVVYGNSLTLGFGTFGMAASSSQKDYFYHVREYLKTINPDVVMERYAASTWEGQTDSQSRMDCLDELIERSVNGAEDLVLIQLSDNVNTDEKRKTYPQDVKALLQKFRTVCPRARIFWIASWYGAGKNYAAIETASRELGTDVIDIRDLAGIQENQSAVGNTYTKDDGTVVEITSTGVASHPGDLGMERIAQRVIERIESYL